MRHARNLPRAAARACVGLGLAALVAVAGTACSTHAGAAAQVGDATIETATLRDVVDRGTEAVSAVPAEQAAQQLDQNGLQRRALSTLVQDQLVKAEAEHLGVTLSGQDADAYYQAYGILYFGSMDTFLSRANASGIATEDIRTIIASEALQNRIIDKLFPDLLATDAEARDQYDFVVERVGEIPLSFEAAKPYLKRFLFDTQRATAIRPVLAETAAREHISINPRFGVWDASKLAVVAVEGNPAGSVATTPGPDPSFDVTTLS